MTCRKVLNCTRKTDVTTVGKCVEKVRGQWHDENERNVRVEVCSKGENVHLENQVSDGQQFDEFCDF